MSTTVAPRCERCGAPRVEQGPCFYCAARPGAELARADAERGEFGIASHVFFWATLVLVVAAEVAVGITRDFGRYHEGQPIGFEGVTWGLMFGAIPLALLVCGLFWRPRVGRLPSGGFLLLPPIVVTGAQYATGPMSGDDLGFGLVLFVALVVAFYLGAALHTWICSVRSAAAR